MVKWIRGNKQRKIQQFYWVYKVLTEQKSKPIDRSPTFHLQTPWNLEMFLVSTVNCQIVIAYLIIATGRTPARINYTENQCHCAEARAFKRPCKRFAAKITKKLVAVLWIQFHRALRHITLLHIQTIFLELKVVC